MRKNSFGSARICKSNGGWTASGRTSDGNKISSEGNTILEALINLMKLVGFLALLAWGVFYFADNGEPDDESVPEKAVQESSTATKI